MKHLAALINKPHEPFTKTQETRYAFYKGNCRLVSLVAINKRARCFLRQHDKEKLKLPKPPAFVMLNEYEASRRLDKQTP